MDSQHPTGSFRAVFDEALELSIDQRDAFLGRACGADVKLRAAVEDLLSAHDRAGLFLADPALSTDLLEARERLAPGTRVGRYALMRILGEGGYGTVYLAEQDPPLRRRVALKVIKPGMDTRQVIARFDRERQALALMDHANIAKVFDAGSTITGHPYFVMELVDGIPITKFCQAHGLPIDARLRLFTKVCGAVHHAHEKGVIHRDLKPANVLVVEQDGAAIPKVIDFGIAKALFPETGSAENLDEGTPTTLHPQLLGTPQYMSPEQASTARGHVDWRSDVYSLGALLYEMLTDVPPFDRARFRFAAAGEISRVLQDVNPPPPSKRLVSKLPPSPQFAAERAEAINRAPLLRGDLDRIVMKAMDKAPLGRYENAAALAADVQHYLDGQPIAARVMPWRDRLRRTTRRHESRIAAVILLLLLLAGIPALLHIRPPPPAPPPAPLVPGLVTEIYADSQFGPLWETRIDTDINDTWPRGVTPAQGMTPPHYSIRWLGILVVPPEGVSRVGMMVDDGVRLYVDDQQVVAFADPAKIFSLNGYSAGRHTIKVEYWNRMLGGKAILLWSRRVPNAQEEIVPASALFHLPGQISSSRKAATFTAAPLASRPVAAASTEPADNSPVTPADWNQPDSAAMSIHFDAIADAISTGTMFAADQTGGKGGASFIDMPPKGAVLIGIVTTDRIVGDRLVIASIRPLFWTADGEIFGATHGTIGSHETRIVAKEGYAVGQIAANSGEARINGLRVEFMRIKPGGSGLDPGDSYSAVMVGGSGGGPPVTLQNPDGKLIIGIQGRSATELHSLGLIRMP